jgi:predicted DCC family thiol-disulfide oxidoreductase YuxK
MSERPHLVLYDGVCGLCTRLTRFLLPRDRRDVFVFASLQGPLAGELLNRYGRSPAALDTFYVLADRGTERERLLERSDAGLFLLKALGAPWSWLYVFRLLPRSLRHAVYGFVARNRYRWFGRLETCPLPDPRHRAKFLD